MNNESLIQKEAEETAGPVGIQSEVAPLVLKNGAPINPVNGENIKHPFFSNTDNVAMNLINKSGNNGAGTKAAEETTKKTTFMPKTTQTVLNMLDSKRLSGEEATLSPHRVISTPYYSGAINRDTELYGTFANGYQPKGILGHGKVSKTGDTIEFETTTLDGQKKTVSQKVKVTGKKKTSKKNNKKTTKKATAKKK